ncbi:hypothetical protein MUP79_10445 [Candidatus Bathyarchaeota archaeon]|nr:hypothetical protein [Candidatus Bathyarchaeota archaeon]
MREALRTRLSKLENKITPKPPRRDLVKEIAQMGVEVDRLKALSPEEFEKIAHQLESQPVNPKDGQQDALRSAIHFIRDEKAVAEYWRSLPESQRLAMTPHPTNEAHDEDVFASYIKNIREKALTGQN